ncbi:TonB-dependent receptor [bacterium SCSIO 12741]|nr:TonB-dependent receptor [bacterium SCSIO 12741]
MIKKITTYLLFVLLGFGLKLQAQKVTLFDIDNLKPVAEVFVIDHEQKHSSLSNPEGKADLTGFQKTDTLIFHHPSYTRKIVSYSEVVAANNTVYLTPSAVDLGEVMVYANKREQLATEIPSTISTIPAREISFNNPQTAADALSESGQVFVQKSQLGGGSPMIRGFSANRILIVVDGVRMNNAIFRAGNLQNIIAIDPNTVDNTEVIYGPGSVIYGSDALGGVMSFHTVKPELSFRKDSTIWKINTLLRYSTANEEKTAHVRLAGGGNKWAAVAGLTLSDYEDLRTGANRGNYPEFGTRTWFQGTYEGQDTAFANSNVNLQKSSGYSQMNLMGKLRYQPTRNIDLNLNLQYSNSSLVPRYDRLTQVSQEATDSTGVVPKYARWDYGPQEWFFGTLEADFDIQNDAWDRSRIIVGYQYFNESRIDRRFNRSTRRTRDERVNAYTVNLEFDKKINSKHSLFYGIEGVWNTVFSQAWTYDIETEEHGQTSTRYPDGGSDWANAAAYVTYNFKLNKKWTFSTGLRYTYIYMKSRFTDTTYYDFDFDEIKLTTSALNGSFLGLIYRPGEKWQLKLNTASGFRSPNVDDIAKVFDSEPGKVIVPNENLKPEFAYNADLSVSRTLRDRGIVELVGFYTYLVDAMVRRDAQLNGQDSILYDGEMSQVQMITNTGKAHIYGASFNLKANLSKKLGVIQTFTWMDGEDLVDNVPLRHVSPAFGKTSAFYKTEKLRAEFYTQYNAWRHWDDLAPEEQGKPHLYTQDGTPAWYTLNIRASYKFLDYFEANVALENILDRHYRPYSSGISAAGRNLILSIRASI